MAGVRDFQRARSPEHKRRREEDLVESARRLASADGVRAVTLTAIATNAGVHPSAVRRYFASREEILLRLAADGWTEWARAVTAALHDRHDVPRADLAELLTATLADRTLFCDLLTHATLNLEYDVPLETAKAYKMESHAALQQVTEAVVRACPRFDAASARDFLHATTALAASLWHISHPPETLVRLYADDPELTHTAIEFAPMLTRWTCALDSGLSCASSGAVGQDADPLPRE
jgi:AcrR family transcriptional regulator